MEQDARIFVAGGTTLAGATLLRTLAQRGYQAVSSEPTPAALTCRRSMTALFRDASPEYVFLTAGASGGIRANQTLPVELMEDNLAVILSVLSAARSCGARKLLYLASACCYPGLCRQPMREKDLFTGPVEPTSAPYATAKLAGLTLCGAYRAEYGAQFTGVLPASLYGPGDEFDPDAGHVIPALIARMEAARLRGDAYFTVWGTGSPRREFLYVDDLADACLFLMTYEKEESLIEGPINVGAGAEISIGDLAYLVARIVGYAGEIRFNPSYPDGAPRKYLDSSRLHALGWRPSVSLEEGLRRTCRWYREHRPAVPDRRGELHP